MCLNRPKWRNRMFQLLALMLLTACSGNYQGSNTLDNYPNDSTGKSELAKDVLLEAIGFWDANKNTQVVPAEHMVEISAFLYLGRHTDWVHDVDTRSMNIRPTGPFIDGIGYNTHQRVRVYYSNGVVDWLRNDRQGDIPDGAMIVKQMYPTDPDNKSYGGEKVTGWAVMIRDGKASKDGWLWFLFFLPDTPSYGSPVLLSQYGMSFCLSCHSGTDNDQGTYSYIGNLTGKDVDQYSPGIIPNPPGPSSSRPVLVATHSSQSPSFGLHVADIETLIKSMETHRNEKEPELSRKIDKHLGKSIPDELFGVLDNFIQDSMSAPVSAPLKHKNPAIVETYGNRGVSRSSVVHMPWDLTTGHTGASPDNLKTFITSDNCRGCHDASLLLGGRQPSMMVYEEASDPNTPENKYNVSIYGEWGTSMMGLAGRDPIFLAQLESEHELRPELKDWTSNLCMSCHQVAGQRQFHLDKNPGYYTSDYTYLKPEGKHLNPKAEYASLGRDGVTCTVCHQIMDEGLGEEKTFTGKFVINPEPGRVFGPYQNEDIKPYYMKQALGIEPVYGEQIKNPALCGSCHAIQLPVLEVGASEPPKPGGQVSHEQTTYLEWANSAYTENPDTTCQGCHMPGDFRDKKTLEFAIANVEDGNFPEVKNRAEDSLITPEPKSGYRRHTLVGLSIVANRMFQQFPAELGITTLDPGTPLTFGPASEGAVHRLQLTEDEMELMAADTAELSASVLDKNSDTWRVQVDIENKAGHKFPSGVGFRRAFLEVTALSAEGTALWGSGQTNAAGVIVDGDAQVLSSEFTKDWQRLQPDFAGQVISREDQVQIFETRHINKDKQLTTSFLGLYKEVKDNRLLPLGWSKDGRYVDATKLVKLGGDEAMFPAHPGKRSIEYHIPATAGAIDRIQVRLLYQSTPPYYLQDRFSTKGQENDRLYYLASHLDLKGSLAENWSVEIEKTVAR
ncbi:MAG: cytochrome P460 family protein [Halioglobus sp.]